MLGASGVFTLVVLLVYAIMFGVAILVVYALVLAIKALKIYINKNP